MFLETSFTSLQSPSGAPSNASSITNGYYSARSQPSPVQIADIISIVRKSRRCNPGDPQIKTTKSLSLNLKFEKPVDLIHDDWFGLAPLASPESLSELSSISSRTSFTNLDKIQPLSASFELKTPKVMRRTPKIPDHLSTCADDIRNVRYFQKLGQKNGRFSRNGGSITNSSSNVSFESASSRNNSPRCLALPRNTKEAATSGESDDFQSAEDILDNVMATAGCADFFNAPTTYLETHFDDFFETQQPQQPSSTLLQVPLPPTPQESDPDIISNFAIDLNLDQEHRSAQFVHASMETTTSSSKPNSLDSGSSCRTPLEVKNVTFNPQIISIESIRGSPESSPNKTRKSDRWHLLPRRNKNKKKSAILSVCKAEQVPKTILCANKRRNSGEEFFSRTEALPLLRELGGTCEKTSPGYVRRKKYVYPAVSVVSKTESNV